MTFISAADRMPQREQIVLVKTGEEWLPYCVCIYYIQDDRIKYFESVANNRLYWFPNEIIGWSPIEDVEKPQIVHCKDCSNRYSELLCAVAQRCDSYSDDDGHDYYIDWGSSEDDDFYCARGTLKEELR